MAVVPDTVGLDHAAALPMVGLTALRSLRSTVPLLAKRVLITGASGGVGRMAIQLASLGGASVIAAVGSPERGRGLASLGLTWCSSWSGGQCCTRPGNCWLKVGRS